MDRRVFISMVGGGILAVPLAGGSTSGNVHGGGYRDLGGREPRYWFLRAFSGLQSDQ